MKKKNYLSLILGRKNSKRFLTILLMLSVCSSFLSCNSKNSSADKESTISLNVNQQATKSIPLDWLTHLGKNTKTTGINEDLCYGVALDKTGNVYCAGRTYSDLGEENGGKSDAFILKLDPQGKILWIKQFGKTTSPDKSMADESCKSLALDEDGNIYCGGYTFSNLGELSGGSADAFIVKLDSQGKVIWLKQLGLNTKKDLSSDHSKEESCESIAVDKFKNVYCAGYTGGHLGKEENGGNENNDAFVLKLDLNGNILWVTQLGSTTKLDNFGNAGMDACSAVTVDNSEGVYCGGHKEINGASRAFVLKLNSSNGDKLWHEFYPHDVQESFCQSVAVDNQKNVYCGGFSSTKNDDTGKSEDAFVLKINQVEGVIENNGWLEHMGDKNESSDRCYGVAVDELNNVYCAGSTTKIKENNGGEHDLFVAKLAPSNGDPIWISHFGETTKTLNGNNSGNEECLSIAMDSFKNIYCAGFTTGPLGEPNAGAKDAFVLKIGPDGVFKKD